MHEEGHPSRWMTDAGKIQARARWAIAKKAGTIEEELQKRNNEASKLSNEREKKEIDRDEEKRRKNSRRNI